MRDITSLCRAGRSRAVLVPHIHGEDAGLVRAPRELPRGARERVPSHRRHGPLAPGSLARGTGHPAARQPPLRPYPLGCTRPGATLCPETGQAGGKGGEDGLTGLRRSPRPAAAVTPPGTGSKRAHRLRWRDRQKRCETCQREAESVRLCGCVFVRSCSRYHRPSRSGPTSRWVGSRLCSKLRAAVSSLTVRRSRECARQWEAARSEICSTAQQLLGH